jgi:hypothetical protein
MDNFFLELRAALKCEAECLAEMNSNFRFITADLANRDEATVTSLAGLGDPEPLAALLIRVSRLRREAADASDEFRRALIQAVGRIERARAAEGGGE